MDIREPGEEKNFEIFRSKTADLNMCKALYKIIGFDLNVFKANLDENRTELFDKTRESFFKINNNNSYKFT